MRLYFSALEEPSEKLLDAHNLYEKRYFEVMGAKIKKEDPSESISAFLSAQESLRESVEEIRTSLIDEGTKLLSKIHAN